MTRRLKHRRTDPSCRRFSGRGGAWSLRRWWYERHRGRTCMVCYRRKNAGRPAFTQADFDEWMRSVTRNAEGKF